MLRAYRLIITNNPYAPENLWETEQPCIDNLSRSARTFGHHMKQRFFLNEKALNWENLRIWHTHYKPKPAHDNVPNWQAYLEWYRQLVVEVVEIVAETGWRGPESPVRLEWERRRGSVI
jgi:hypothetical protein